MGDPSTEVIQTIKMAWERGHTVVPLLGAGISIESGVPRTEDIMRYLVMIERYIDCEAYRPKYPKQIYKHVDEKYQQHPIQFIQHYGWPDRFQLQHELRLIFDDETRQPPASQRVSSIARAKNFENWIDSGLSERLESATSIRQWQARSYRAFIDRVRSGVLDDKIPTAWSLLGDWKAVIREFTEFNHDNADSLFEHLYRWRRPGHSHQLWALLTRLMGLRVFFTTNFDPFIEQALREQGIDHRVFGVEHGDHLPHRSLVTETVSVIKMHGDTHRLLLDEKLDYPPASDYLERLRACLPRDPVLLVMGCGGNDPRINEIVKHLAGQDGPGDVPRVIWLHFGGDVPNISLKQPNSIIYARVTSPGLFLSHLYAFLRNQHPASRVPYQATPVHPIGVSEQIASGDPRLSLEIEHLASDSDQAHIFVRTDPEQAHMQVRTSETASYSGSASQKMAEFVFEQKVSKGYTPIWLNLEAHHGVAGVVQQIVEQCRVQDVFLMPFSVPELGSDGIELTTQRILHVLRRGRYVLAFDGLEAFFWSPTVHHGGAGTVVDTEFQRLLKLIETLLDHPDLTSIDAKICVSLDPFDRGYADASILTLNKYASDFAARFRNRCEPPSAWTRQAESVASHQGDDTICDDGKMPIDLITSALSILACFRRPRHLAALRSVFHSLLDLAPDFVDETLNTLTKIGCIVPVEGGSFRMERRYRNVRYRLFSDRGTAECITALAASSVHGPEHARSAEACYFLTAVHGFIARYYHAENYLASEDPWAFFEYYYHRVASIRYLAKLEVVLRTPGAGENQFWCIVPPSAHIRSERPPRNSGRWVRCSADEILSYAVEEREELVKALRHALTQALDRLLRGTPGAQLEAWCKRVLAEDYGVDDAATSRGPSKMETAFYRPFTASVGGHGKQESEQEVSDNIVAIASIVRELRRRNLFEQGRYSEARSQALGHLHALLEDSGDPPSSLTRKLIEKAFLSRSDPALRVKCVLDVLACGGDPDRAELLGEVLALHDPASKSRPATGRERHTAAREPKELLEYQNRLRALCMLAEDSCASSDRERFTKCATEETANRINQAELLDQGLDWCRVLAPEQVRESSHDAYYLRFRTRLLIAQARLQCHGSDNRQRFREVDRLLESARAGVSSDDHKRLARVDLVWADSLLRQADHDLQLPDERGDVSRDLESRRKDALNSARVSYVRAGDALQRAHEQLTRGSRAIDQWVAYHRLWAQYQTEWCLFYLATLEAQIRSTHVASARQHGRSPMRELAEFAPRDIARLLKRIQRGLGAIQAGLAMQRGAQDLRLIRTWRELLCVGMVYGMSTVAATSCYEELLHLDDASHEHWPLGVESDWEHWVLMNRRARLSDTVESAGCLAGYLAQRISKEEARSQEWRASVAATVASYAGCDGSVSLLRARALEMADRLDANQDPGELCGILKASLNDVARDPAAPLAPLAPLAGTPRRTADRW
jgi:hypothetical protein